MCMCVISKVYTGGNTCKYWADLSRDEEPCFKHLQFGAVNIFECVMSHRLMCHFTHCNTLQHTATHCNMVQHNATQCNTLRCHVTHLDVPGRCHFTHIDVSSHTYGCVVSLVLVISHMSCHTHRCVMSYTRILHLHVTCP